MSISSVSNKEQYYASNAKTTTSGRTKGTDRSVLKDTFEPAAAYERSTQIQEANTVYKRDDETITRLKAEIDQRNQGLRDLVEKLLLKQGKTLDDSADIYALLREGKLKADPQTSAQAQKDISEDGYWGVKQTSERIVSFAKALAGGDPSKAEVLIQAVKKGFEAATKTWGGELPQICKDTLDTAIGKLEEWRDGILNVEVNI